jgi:hypothetical protein
MTATRSASRTTPMKWVITTVVVLSPTFISSIRSRTRLWIVASSPAVGSSAISTAGRDASASAIITRWHMPPREVVRVVAEPPRRGVEVDPAPASPARASRSAPKAIE